MPFAGGGWPSVDTLIGQEPSLVGLHLILSKANGKYVSSEVSLLTAISSSSVSFSASDTSKAEAARA
jgi:hypothetical protein